MSTMAIIIATAVALSVVTVLLWVYFHAEERSATTKAAGAEPEPRPDEWSEPSLETAEEETGEPVNPAHRDER